MKIKTGQFFQLTERCSREGVVVVHELAPSDDHDGSGMIVETVIGVHSSRHHAGEWQVAAGVRDARGVDAIGEQRAD